MTNSQLTLKKTENKSTRTPANILIMFSVLIILTTNTQAGWWDNRTEIQGKAINCTNSGWIQYNNGSSKTGLLTITNTTCQKNDPLSLTSFFSNPPLIMFSFLYLS